VIPSFSAEHFEAFDFSLDIISLQVQMRSALATAFRPASKTPPTVAGWCWIGAGGASCPTTDGIRVGALITPCTTAPSCSMDKLNTRPGWSVAYSVGFDLNARASAGPLLLSASVTAGSGGTPIGPRQRPERLERTDTNTQRL
jgi:hypothetical protein